MEINLWLKPRPKRAGDGCQVQESQTEMNYVPIGAKM